MNMKQEKLIFKNSKGQKIVGVLYSPDKKDFPVTIYCHGYRYTKEACKAPMMADKLTKYGIGLFAFDFSGRGESDGNFEDTTITQYINDLNCCIDFISKYTDKIALIGESFGGFIVLLESIKNNKIRSVVLLSPISRFPHKNRDEYADISGWKKRGYSFTRSKRFGELKINYSFYEDGLKYQNQDFKNIKISTLIFHGDKDESVDFNDSIKLSKYIKNSKLIILEGADHNYTNPKDFDKVINTTASFLAENLK